MVYLERVKKNIYDINNNNRHSASTPAPTISCAHRKEQKVGEILMTSDSIGLYVCCTCELSTASSSSSSSASNSNEPLQSFVTEEIQAFWEHVRNQHRSPGKTPQKCEQESSAIINENLPKKAQDHNENNNISSLDIIVIEDDDDDDKMDIECCDGYDGDTNIEETLKNMMGDEKELKKELPNGHNEAAISLDRMINEAYKEDNIATHGLESSTTMSNGCVCPLQSKTQNDRNINENIHLNVIKEHGSIRGSNNNENIEREIILIDDDEEESYHKPGINNNNNNKSNSISPPLLKELLDINDKSLNNADLVENQKENNAEELDQLLESFDEDGETVVNGDLDAVIRKNSVHLLNARKDILEKYLSTQNANISFPINETRTDNRVLNNYEQVNPVLSQAHSCRHFPTEQIINMPQQSRMCPRQEEGQLQFSTTSPTQILTTTTTITSTNNAGATPFPTMATSQRANALQFSSTISPTHHMVSPPFSPLASPLQHINPIQFSSATTSTTTTSATTMSIGQNNAASRNEEDIPGNDSRPLKCNFCPERFHAFWQKNFHEKVHFLSRSRRASNSGWSNEEPSQCSIYNCREFQCKICGIRISSKERLKVHHEQYHVATSKGEQNVEQNESHSGMQSKYQCEMCKTAYKQKKSLKYHIQRRHPETLLRDVSKKTLPSTNGQLPSSLVPSLQTPLLQMPSPQLPLSQTTL